MGFPIIFLNPISLTSSLGCNITRLQQGQENSDKLKYGAIMILLIWFSICMRTNSFYNLLPLEEANYYYFSNFLPLEEANYYYFSNFLPLEEANYYYFSNFL